MSSFRSWRLEWRECGSNLGCRSWGLTPSLSLNIANPTTPYSYSTLDTTYNTHHNGKPLQPRTTFRSPFSTILTAIHLHQTNSLPLPLQADKLRTQQQLEALQTRYIGTGHADTTKFEWTSNIHRDSYASYIGHPPMLSYMSIGLGQPKELVRMKCLEAMIRPVGAPPERED